MPKSWEERGEVAKGVTGAVGMNSTLKTWRDVALAVKAASGTTYPGGGNEVQRAILAYVLSH